MAAEMAATVDAAGMNSGSTPADYSDLRVIQRAADSAIKSNFIELKKYS